jgi:hypothetical protein
MICKKKFTQRIHIPYSDMSVAITAALRAHK